MGQRPERSVCVSDFVLFQMWGPFRQSLIDGHLFYVEQARKRLLSQFDDLEKESDKAAEEWLAQHSHHFDPDHHDQGDFYESANDAGIEFYQLLSDMRDRTRLSVVAGMFHHWDKQLRDWLVREIQHWHRGDRVASKIWSMDFAKTVDLLESMNWKLRGAKYIDKLGACRLVVNVYKHGEGGSFDDLKRLYPEYLNDPFNALAQSFLGPDDLDHTNLSVNDAQIEEFSIAIVQFWLNVPENIFTSEMTTVPEWFANAVLKDRETRAS